MHFLYGDVELPRIVFNNENTMVNGVTSGSNPIYPDFSAIELGSWRSCRLGQSPNQSPNHT